jgi:hypothetical protein
MRLRLSKFDHPASIPLDQNLQLLEPVDFESEACMRKRSFACLPR